MDLALCYESVVPSRGGAEMYIADLARRLARDGHSVHLYGCRRDATALPASIHFHRLAVPGGPRFLRPWRFAAASHRQAYRWTAWPSRASRRARSAMYVSAPPRAGNTLS